MSVLLIAAIGVSIVLLGILVLRLHPFLALVLGSIVVLLATPEAIWLKHELANDAHPIVDVSETGGMLKFDPPIAAGKYVHWPKNQPVPDKVAFDLNPGEDGVWEKGWMFIGRKLERSNEGRINVPSADFEFQIDGRVVSILAVERSNRNRYGTITKRLASGLSGTFDKIGLPIVMAAIIGMCLLESGAAARLVDGIRGVLGAQRTTPTLMVSGFLLGVPVFFDTVFYLLLPLAKAFGKQRPRNYLLAVMAIIVGATMAHSLVPPTPGPLYVASALKIPMGIMMIGGIIVGGTAALTGYAYALWCNRWMTLELPADAKGTSSSNEPTSSPVAIESTLEGSGGKSRPQLSIWLASLPLAIPIACLGGIEIWKVCVKPEALPTGSLAGLIDLISDPGFVLMVAALIAFGILRLIVPIQKTGGMMSQAIADAGTILLLTCAGGAFGAALKQLDLADEIAHQFHGNLQPFGLLIVSFILTGLIRVAQGSATVAMITTVGIIGPLVEAQSLPFHTVYVALSIGCGSKLFPWMNDSGFWQVSTMSGMTTQQTLKTFSVALSIMGCVGFAITLLGAWSLPFKN